MARLLLCVAVLALVASQGAAAAPRDDGEESADYEPVFGFTFNPYVVQFETVGVTELPAACRAGLSPELLLFGRIARPGETIAVLSPIVRNHVAFGAGLLLVSKDGVCSSQDPKAALSQDWLGGRDDEGAAQRLGAEEASALWHDIYRRYGYAFGGRANFSRWLEGHTKSLGGFGKFRESRNGTAIVR